MNIPDYTVVIALDEKHVPEFAETLRTWKRFRPELWGRPWVLLCDFGTPRKDFFDDVFAIVPGSTEPYPIGYKDNRPQRDKMLSSFVQLLPQWVTTPYWLKFDAHTIATSGEPWLDGELFKHTPAIVAPPWGYTKPASFIDDLDDWAYGIPDFEEFDPPLQDGPYKISERSGIERIHHPRITSVMGFFRTDFTRQVAEWCKDAMPVPSQDTTHWYCAARMGLPIVRHRFPGFKHIPGGLKRVKKAVKEVLENE
jgi:hypothetical protein